MELGISKIVSITNNGARVDGQPTTHFNSEDRLANLKHLFKDMQIEYPKFYKMDGLSKLGFLASELLLQDQETALGKTGIALQNKESSVHADTLFLQSLGDIPSPALFVYTLPNIVTGEICIRHKLEGENTFMIFEAFNSTHLVQTVYGMMEDESHERCIAGWVEFGAHGMIAFLVLVVREAGKQPFTVNTISNIYTSEHGN